MSGFTPAPAGHSVSAAIARFIAAQGVKRVYTLPGSHVKPICSALMSAGVRIVSARDERAAVHMAHAEADLTGTIGVAVVTAGPGLTNAVTGMASAFLARTPLLVLSARVPDGQAGMGALEEVPQADLVRPVCRHVREISDGRHVLQGLHLAVGAALGNDGPAGPAYVDFDPGLLKAPLDEWHALPFWFEPVERAARLPSPDRIDAALSLIRRSRRPIVIGGRGAHDADGALASFLEATGSLYLDTRESRGALPPDHPNAVPAQRGRLIAEADLVITLGRRLDFELGFGSPAIFAEHAQFLRIGRTFEELGENRPGDVQLCADVGLALQALLDAGAAPADPDGGWFERQRAADRDKNRALADRMAALPIDADGRMHPLTLIDQVNKLVDEETICIVDGGDILSHARLGLRCRRYLDLGPFGCLGSGVPYAVAAALAFPDAGTIAIIGDGAFGFSAIDVETAVRTQARALFIVANNDAWNIERQDQLARYPDQELGSTLTPCRYDLVARGLGAHGERVEKAEDLPAALARGLAHRPAVIDVAISRSALSSDSKAGLANVPPLHAVQAWDDAERERLQGQRKNFSPEA